MPKQCRRGVAARSGAAHPFLTAHAPLILSSTDLVYRSKVLNTLARGARYPIGRTKTAGPKRVAAWSGLPAARLLIPAAMRTRSPRRADPRFGHRL